MTRQKQQVGRGVPSAPDAWNNGVGTQGRRARDCAPHLCVFLALCALLGGCASYTWGTKLPAAYRAIAVPVFENATAQPEIEARLTSDTRREIMRDGALRLASPGDAAILLHAKITRFDSAAVRFSGGVRDLPVEFRVTLAAEVWVEDKAGNILLPKATLSQDTTVIPSRGSASGVLATDMPAALQNAAVRLSAQLARDIVLHLNTPVK